MSKFPHLTANGNESSFPDVSNIRTYQYDNKYDYSKFDTVQMDITLCKVPWDMGEAHIGNRTISGIGNVVHFGSKKERDKWFDKIPDSECFRFATKYRELHRDNAIVVPIPYDVAARYNYIAVYYEPMASTENPVMYETSGGIDAWFWFVREVEFLSPNSTKLHLLNDAWQTFIYDMDIPYMMLDRGHAPMHETSVSKYLGNPVSNCQYLLAPEENEPEPPRITTSTHEHVFNSGNMYAVIVTTAVPAGTWGSKSDNTWTVPSSQGVLQGVPSYRAFAIAAGSLSGFLGAVDKQFIQTVQAVCFVSDEMISFGTSFTFGGYTCYYVSGSYKQATVHTLSQGDFGYSSAYKNIAKLYTYPYAVIRLTDQDGNQTDVRIEDTNGKIQLDYCVSLVYPWLKINAQITSTGKASRRNITFENVTARTMPIGGNWHDLLFSFDIPMFAVTQGAGDVNDYATHYDRLQQAIAADNAQANQQANADNITNNAALQAAANSSIAAISNTSTATDSNITQTYNSAAATGANYIIVANATSTIAAADQQATIGAVSSVAQGAVGAIGSGNVAGAIASVAGGIIGAAGTMASVSVANALTSAQSGNAQTSNNMQALNSNISTNAKSGMQQTAVSDTAAAQNALVTGSAANTSATLYANAARDRSTVSSAISNQQAQAAIGEPSTFGDFQNGDYATSRPLALFSNVITQDDYTIRKCGDDFLRYGYSFGAQWKFNGNWCPMPHFTYWRLTDFWVKGLQIPDMYVDKLRFFLFGGVTVWKNPDDIGHVTIYENV
jgi:hypothetical protein